MNILIELDAETYKRLEKVAPAKSRKRSAFIRAAIQTSLWQLEEERTREAYLRTPDDDPALLDPDVWEPLPYGGFDPPPPERASRSRVKRSARKSEPGGTNKARSRRSTKSPRARRRQK
jgi:hypothetical protein